jgi:hypothetical protein
MQTKSRRYLLAFFVSAAVASGAWWILHAQATSSLPNSQDEASSAAKMNANAVVAAAQGAVLSTTTTAAKPASGTKLNGTWVASRNSSAATAHRLMASASTAKAALALIDGDASVVSADKRYFLAVLSELCGQQARASQPSNASVPKATPAPVDSSQSVEQQRARRTLEQRRVAAFCEGLPTQSLEVQMRYWAQAAAEGDPRARARLQWAQFETQFARDPTTVGNPNTDVDQFLSPRTWTAEMLAAMAQGLASKDPSAIVNFGSMLQQTAHSNYVALADNGESLSELPMGAWNVLACAYGARCGPEDNSTLLSLCANEGKCNLTSLEDYFRQQMWTGAEAAHFDAVRAYLIALVETGDVTRLTIRPFDSAAPTPVRRFIKGPGRSYPPA